MQIERENHVVNDENEHFSVHQQSSHALLTNTVTITSSMPFSFSMESLCDPEPLVEKEIKDILEQGAKDSPAKLFYFNL